MEQQQQQQVSTYKKGHCTVGVCMQKMKSLWRQWKIHRDMESIHGFLMNRMMTTMRDKLYSY